MVSIDIKRSIYVVLHLVGGIIVRDKCSFLSI